MKLRAFHAFCTLVILSLVILSCSERKISVKVTQYTDPSNVTGVAKHEGAIYCATQGGLVKWDLATSEYTISTTADGLPSNVLTDIIVDGKNRLWVSSYEGVGLYTGDSWKLYDVSSGLPSPEVNDLALDRDGNVWTSTQDGAAYLDGGNFKLLAEKGSPGRKEINCIYFDRGNNCWIGTEKTGIFVKMEGSWIPSGRSGLPANSARGITQSWDFRMWAASWSGIYVWDGTGWIMHPSYDNMGTLEARFMDSTRERIWFFTANGVHSSHGSNWWNFTSADGMVTNDVTSGLVESDNMVYAGTTDGLSVIENKSIKNYVISNKPVGHNFISLAADDRNRLWVGTWETGVSLYSDGYWTGILGSRPDDLATVRSFSFGPDGTIVFNTREALLIHSGDEWKRYNRKSGMSGDDIRCGLFDTDGRYWAGTASGICYLGKDNTWKRFRQYTGLPSEDVWVCGIDSTGTVWFGTTDGIVSFSGGQLTDRSPEVGTDNLDVRSLLVKGDTVYFGTNNGKLISYNGREWNVFGSNYLSTDRGIHALVADPDGSLWLGTYGDGLIKLHGDTVTKFTMADGLPSDYVRDMTFYDGKLWVACYGGIVTVEIETIEE